MATVYKLKSTCFCGGQYEDNTQGDLPPGTYLKCSKCRRQALDPDLLKQYKKQQEKKKKGDSQ